MPATERLAVIVVMEGMADFGGQHGQATAIAVELARRGHAVAYLSRWPLERRSERLKTLLAAGVDVLTPKWADARLAHVRPTRYNALRARRFLQAIRRRRSLPSRSAMLAGDDRQVQLQDVDAIATRLARRWLGRRGSAGRSVFHIVARPSAALLPRLRGLGAALVFSEFGQLALYELDLESATPFGVDACTADSPDGVRDLERLEGTHVAMIPCIAGFDEPPTALPELATSFVLTNRLVPAKRTEIAVRAAALGDLRIDIHGGGPSEPALRTLIAELGVEGGVRLHGLATRQQIREALDSAHAFVMCSLPMIDGTPMSVLEAMSRGRPVVAFPFEGLAVLVRDGVEGLYFDGTAEGLAAALERLATEPGLAARLGHAARARWEQEFTPAMLTDRYEEVYRGALERAGVAAAGAGA